MFSGVCGSRDGYPPILSPAPTTVPPFVPPPAKKMVCTAPQWSRNHSLRPTPRSCKTSAINCWARMWNGLGGATTGSTNPSCHRSINADARKSPSSVVARKRQFDVVSGRRPVRPMRCRNEETLGGASIWMTRSRSPTSRPSSSELVATITQFCRCENARSALRRSSSPSELCDTKVSTPACRSSIASCSTRERLSQKTRRFCPGWRRRMSLAATTTMKPW